MKLQCLQYGSGAVSVEIPDSAVAITDFLATGNAALSVSSAETWAKVSNGLSLDVLLLANKISPDFPVSVGERLFLVGDAAQTVLIYYSTE